MQTFHEGFLPRENNIVRPRRRWLLLQTGLLTSVHPTSPSSRSCLQWYGGVSSRLQWRGRPGLSPGSRSSAGSVTIGISYYSSVSTDVKLYRSRDVRRPVREV